jgi:hypothetical protein
LPLGGQGQQGRFIGLAVDAGQSAHGFGCQQQFCQGFIHQTLQQAQAGVTLTAKTQPETGGVPAASLSGVDVHHHGRMGRFGAGARLQASGGRQLQPAATAVVCLHLDRPWPSGGRVHQATPIACPPAPAPGSAEAVQAQPSRGGSGAGEHRLAAEAGGDPLAEPIGAGSVAADQGNDEAALRIHHHHSRITFLVREQGGNQAGHESAGPDDHKRSG